MRTPLLAIVLFALTSPFLASSASAQGYSIPGIDDNAQAGLAFVKWAESQGYSGVTARDSGKAVTIETNKGHKAVINIKASTTMVDRVIFNVSFKSGNGLAKLAQKLKLANDINDQINLCSFSVDDEGDFTFTFVLTFDDQMSPALFRKFLAHVDFSIDAIYKRYAKEFEQVTE